MRTAPKRSITRTQYASQRASDRTANALAQATKTIHRACCFAGCPNLILTPHIAGVTRESNVRVSTLVADKVAAALDALRETA